MATSRSFAEFERRMALLGEKYDERRRRMMRRVGIAVDQAVVLSTPVDTGRARANWLMSIGAPLHHELPAPGSPAAATAAALSQAQTALARYRKGDLYLTNNVAYIGALNRGSSRQASANFVETAALAGAIAASRARLLSD